jgi:hypothetical protein
MQNSLAIRQGDCHSYTISAGLDSHGFSEVMANVAFW